MSGRTVSRRKLADFVAQELSQGNGTRALQQAAAYLVETRQTHSVGLLVRDIEAALARSGVVVADVVSAHTLTKEDKAAIAEIFSARELHTREIIDTDALGGLRIEAAGKRLDATLRRKINLLKETGLRKGTA